MSKLTKTPYAILGVLSISAMSGYEIGQFMQQSTANFWSESDGQLYPALVKLVKEGFINCEATQSNGLREKKVYSITAEGMTELKKWLAQEPETQSVRNEFMLKFFFGGNMLPANNLEHVQAHRYQTKSILAYLYEAKKQFTQEDLESPQLPYWEMSIQYGIHLAEAKIKWCDETISVLEKMKHEELI